MSRPMTADWGKLHLGSRQELCHAACLKMNIAEQSWAEMEPWLQCLLARHMEQSSGGKVTLAHTHVRKGGKCWRVDFGLRRASELLGAEQDRKEKPND